MNRFSIQSNILGYEVVDNDGRPVTAPLGLTAARAEAARLNAVRSRGQLCAAFGAPRNGTRRKAAAR